MLTIPPKRGTYAISSTINLRPEFEIVYFDSLIQSQYWKCGYKLKIMPLFLWNKLQSNTRKSSNEVPTAETFVLIGLNYPFVINLRQLEFSLILLAPDQKDFYRKIYTLC